METFYCDDYEAITGKQPGSADEPIQTKVITSPAAPVVEASGIEPEVASAPVEPVEAPAVEAPAGVETVPEQTV